MKLELTAAAALTATLAMAAPVVSDVEMTQKSSKQLTITYRLSEPAVVTLDVLTNATDGTWVSIGGENVTNVWGDVNRVVRDVETARTICWRPSDAWKANFARSYTVRAEVKAWATNAPPTYMVVDLMQEADKGGDPVRYFEDPSFFPYGRFAGKGDGIDDVYRGRYIVMRKIPAKGATWQMGSPTGELGKSAAEDAKDRSGSYNESYNQNAAQWLKETAHYVTLTKDYYMGVFEVTHEQCCRYIGVGWLLDDQSKWPLPLGGDSKSGLVTYGQFRSKTLRWPGDGHAVDDDTAIARLRQRSGLDFDLPTEAQWEFACRAGTTSALYNGQELTSVSDENESLNDIAWYSANSGNVLHKVGFKEPNGFGLYDMLGNVGEFCLDRIGTDLGTAYAVDPVGATSGSSQVLKGGAFVKWPAYSRAAFRQNYVNVDNQYRECGFRLWAPAVAK